jgi:hypothetical protein
LELIDHGLSIVSYNRQRSLQAELYRLEAGAPLMCRAPDAEIWIDQALQQRAPNRRDRSNFARQMTWPGSDADNRNTGGMLPPIISSWSAPAWSELVSPLP